MGALRTRRRFLLVSLLLAGTSGSLGCEDNGGTSSAEPSERQSEAPREAGVVPPDQPAALTQPLTRTAAGKPPNMDSSGEPLLPILAALLAVTTLLFGVLTFWLFRWRRKLPDGQVSLVPEQLLQVLNTLTEANRKSLEIGHRSTSGLASQYAEIQRGFEIFATTAASKDKEIERLRHGTDRQALAQFARRFVRVLRLIDSDIAEDRALGRDTSALESIRTHLHDALTDCGAEPFSPAPGEDYRDRPDVADGARSLQTDDAAKDWKIARTIEPGFHLRTADRPVLVERAVVEIYRYPH